jgi:hypothetical protein
MVATGRPGTGDAAAGGDAVAARPFAVLVVRVALVAQAVATAAIGLWAAFAPRGFYDEFPGAGRAWVSADGPYNEHLVRDFGDLNLALAFLLAMAAVTLGRELVTAVSVATLVYQGLHFVYHLRHLDLYDTGDQVANVVSLALTITLPVVVLVAQSRAPAPVGYRRPDAG